MAASKEGMSTCKEKKKKEYFCGFSYKIKKSDFLITTFILLFILFFSQ